MPLRERPFRNGPPGYMRNGYNRGPRDDQRNSFGDFHHEKPDRPGYFAGNNRPFRMDKVRDEPLEREERGLSAKEMRDQRNKPSQFDRR